MAGVDIESTSLGDDTGQGWGAAVARLLADRTTAEVVDAFHTAGIRPLLLKGPVIARWLYSDAPEKRGYVDSDLLVSPDDREPAIAVLRNLGFRTTDTVRLPGERIPHAQSFERDGAASLDLHRTIHDLEDVDVERVWGIASAQCEPIAVGGVVVDSPGVLARTLHAVFHVSLEESETTTAVEDLRRAVQLVDPDTWRRAAALAEQLGVADILTAKLRLAPGGRDLAERLGLDTAELPARLLTTREEVSPPYVHSVSRLLELPNGRERLRYLRAKIVPTPTFLRQWTPIAGRGAAGLILAYLLRIGWSLISVPVAPVLWWRARRQAQRVAASRGAGMPRHYG